MRVRSWWFSVVLAVTAIAGGSLALCAPAGEPSGSHSGGDPALVATVSSAPAAAGFDIYRSDPGRLDGLGNGHRLQLWFVAISGASLIALGARRRRVAPSRAAGLSTPFVGPLGRAPPSLTPPLAS